VEPSTRRAPATSSAKARDLRSSDPVASLDRRTGPSPVRRSPRLTLSNRVMVWLVATVAQFRLVVGWPKVLSTIWVRPLPQGIGRPDPDSPLVAVGAVGQEVAVGVVAVGLAAPAGQAVVGAIGHDGQGVRAVCPGNMRDLTPTLALAHRRDGQDFSVRRSVVGTVATGSYLLDNR
jgi:hypothetical protein